MSAIKKRHFLIAHAATFSLCIGAQWLFSIIIYDIQIQIQNIHNSAKSVNKVKMAVINSYKRFQFLLKCRNLKFMYVSKLRYIFCKKWWNRGKKSQQRQEVEGTMNCHTLSISYKRGIRKSWKRQKGTNSKKERSERNETKRASNSNNNNNVLLCGQSVQVEWTMHKKWSRSNNNLFSRRNISSLKLLTLFAC